MNDPLRKAAEMALEALEELRFANAPFLDEAMEALRQALAQPVKSYCGGKPNYCTEPEDWVKQPEQEPEWIDDDFGTMWQKCGKKDCGKFVVRIGKVDCWNGDCPEKEPKREWVDLAKEDMPDGDNPMFDTNEFYAGMAWAAAKLKEKNT